MSKRVNKVRTRLCTILHLPMTIQCVAIATQKEQKLEKLEKLL